MGPLYGAIEPPLAWGRSTAPELVTLLSTDLYIFATYVMLLQNMSHHVIYHIMLQQKVYRYLAISYDHFYCEAYSSLHDQTVYFEIKFLF